jgi:hypothetical protein
MARQLLFNESPTPDGATISVTVGQALQVRLLLCDADDATPGDSWMLATTGPSPPSFVSMQATVPAGAVSPVSLTFDAPGGFAQPGTQQILITKMQGMNANPTVPTWTINVQIAPAAQPQPQMQGQPAQQVTQQPQPAVTRQPQPAGAGTATTQQRPRSTRANRTGAQTPNAGGNLVNVMSLATIIVCALFLGMLAWLVWALVDTMKLTNASCITQTVDSPET